MSRKYYYIVFRSWPESNRLSGSTQRVGMDVGGAHELIDFRDQFLHALERPPSDDLLGDAIEPDFHLIQPGGIGRGEMNMKARSRCQPTFHSRMFVRGVVVDR